MDKIDHHSSHQLSSGFPICKGKKVLGVVSLVGALALEVGGIFFFTRALDVSRISCIQPLGVGENPKLSSMLGGVCTIAGGILLMLSAGVLFSSKVQPSARLGSQCRREKLVDGDIVGCDADIEQLTFDLGNIPVVVNGELTGGGLYPDDVQFYPEDLGGKRIQRNFHASDEYVDVEVRTMDGEQNIYHHAPIYYESIEGCDVSSTDEFFVLPSAKLPHEQHMTVYRHCVD